MKQILAFLLAAVMCMSLLTACGRNNTNNNQNSTPSTEGNNTTPPETTIPEQDNNSSEKEPMPENETMGDMLRSDATLEEVIMKLGEELGITMPTKLDDQSLKEVFGIEPEWIEEYYGEYSAANTSADHLLAFKVKEGHIEDVRSALEKHQDTIAANLDDTMKEQLDKARNATIVQRGNYVFFVIAGDMLAEADQETNRAQELIDSFFE